MPLYRDDYGAYYWSLRGDVTGEVVRDTPFHKDAGMRVLRVRPGQEGRILWTVRGAFALLGLEALAILALAAGLVIVPAGWQTALAVNAFLPTTVLAVLALSVLLPLSCEWTIVRHPLRIVYGQPRSLLLAPLLPLLGPLLIVLATAAVFWRQAGVFRGLRTIVHGADLWVWGIVAAAVLGLAVLAGWLIRQCWVGWKEAHRRPPPRILGLRVAASRERRRDRTGS
ncbi:hypothetical protein [Nitrospirillum amazonense]|uniref:Uncharacterized protein n=1 Tax=Nitrospirillum amazonense TaxID=28077 RepID=A0A560JPV3_9PROT|nr:hypothetical protein [Nitrospirillum amazonense]MDG3442325.1 hypothetical protein [Nitrospirillum amazonense]TWB73178.1 hypothetical protein FBZ87_10598 [Nitrospirillum amazonense]